MEEGKNPGGRPAAYTDGQIFEIVSELRANNPKLYVTPNMVDKVLKARGLPSSNMASLKPKVLSAIERYDNQETDRLLLTVGEADRVTIKENLAPIERIVLTTLARHMQTVQASVLGRLQQLEAELALINEANNALEDALTSEQATTEDLRDRIGAMAEEVRVLQEKLAEATITNARLAAKLEVHESALMRGLRFRSDDHPEASVVPTFAPAEHWPDAPA